MIEEPKWKFKLIDSVPIKVDRKYENDREIDATNLTNGLGFVLDVPSDISIKNIKLAKCT